MPNGGGGDYARWNGFYQSKNTDIDGTASPAVVPKTTTNHQIWVQKIAAYGGAVTAVGSGGTAIGALAAAGVMDWGPQGTPLDVGESLNITVATGRVHIEAYEKLAVPMAIGSNN